MNDRDPHPTNKPLSDLKARLAKARLRHKEPDRDENPRGMTGWGMGFRVGIELAGTLAVGVAIGWALDRWLGTKPWLLVVFFFLGAAAGVLNVYRAVSGMGLAPGYRRDADGPGDGTDSNRDK